MRAASEILAATVKELSLEVPIGRARVSLVLPPMATLDRLVVMPELSRRDTALAVRRVFGETFRDAGHYQIAWVRTGDADPPREGTVIYASLCRRSTISQYRQLLHAAGLPEASIAPHAWSNFRLCPESATVLLLFDEGDEVLRVATVRDRLPVKMRLEQVPRPDPSIVLRILEIEEAAAGRRLPIVLTGRWHDRKVLDALKGTGIEVLEPAGSMADGPAAFPLRFHEGSTWRLMPAVTAGLILLQLGTSNLLAGSIRGQISSARLNADRLVSFVARANRTAVAQGDRNAARQPHDSSSLTQWPAVWRHVESVRTGLTITGVEMAGSRSGSARAGPSGVSTPEVTLDIFGQGRIEAVLEFQSRLQRPPVRSAWLSVLLREGTEFRFQVRVAWDP
jgi:hypothetical protein